MRYALEKPDGVLMTCGSTPLPDGAIEPVTNWAEMAAVAYKYRKIIEGAVAEMTQAEKDAVDAAYVVTPEDAQVYLNDTDWYIIRSVDPGNETPCPQDILDQREAMRELIE